MKSSRHSGNSVHCPRSASSTKRLIDSPVESRRNHNSGTAFSHSQGHLQTSAEPEGMSASHPKADVPVYEYTPSSLVVRARANEKAGTTPGLRWLFPDSAVTQDSIFWAARWVGSGSALNRARA